MYFLVRYYQIQWIDFFDDQSIYLLTKIFFACSIQIILSSFPYLFLSHFQNDQLFCKRTSVCPFYYHIRAWFLLSSILSSFFLQSLKATLNFWILKKLTIYHQKSVFAKSCLQELRLRICIYRRVFQWPYGLTVAIDQENDGIYPAQNKINHDFRLYLTKWKFSKYQLRELIVWRLQRSYYNYKGQQMISILQFQTFIEKQVMQEENSPPIPIQDMYNIKNRNYQWQSFKYQIPRSYHQNQPIRQTLQNKPKHKTNYIDSAISIKKFVPAPNTYEPKIQSRPVSGKMDKNPRKTIAQTIINQAKRQKTPGPATYFARPKTAAARINKNTPEYREHYLYQVQYLSSECPGVGEYNVNYFKRKHVISPKFHRQISVSKSSSFLLDKQHQTKELKKKLSPTLVMGTFDWLASQKKKQNKNLFGKSSRFTQGSKFDRKPGPNSYKLNLKWNDSKNILLKTCSTVANLKSVYYN